MKKNEQKRCACCVAPKLIFSCSGGSDVGALADQEARKLTKEGKGKMYCLAGIGGRVSGIMATTESAAKIMVIDGCPIGCAKKTLEQAGFKKYLHLQLSDIGLQKGNSPGMPENIDKVCEKALGFLAD